MAVYGLTRDDLHACVLDLRAAGMKRRAVRIGIGIAAVLALAGALVLFAEAWIPLLYDVHPPKPDYSPPLTLAQSQRDELHYLRNITRLDWSYTEQTREAANAVIDQAIRGPLPLSSGAFQLLIARVLAIADNGHTNLGGASTANRLNRLPIRVYSFADGVFVVRALPQGYALLGARILEIDGTPMDELRARLRQYTGGTENEKNVRLPFYLESPELLHAAGLAQECSRVALTVLDAAGVERTVSLEALPANPHAPKSWPSEELRPRADPAEDKSWRVALAGKVDSLPLFAAAPHAFFRETLAGTDIFYVRFDSNNDDDGTSVTAFAKRTMKEILAATPAVIVVDLRMNGGGDYTLTAAFMRGLPVRLPDARIYVLLSQETFSAGMTDAAFLKQAGGSRVMFVGDWPGDRIRFHSEGSKFCLPYTHVCVMARTAIHDYSTRWCRPVLECYPLDRLYPVAIRSFAPEILAPLTYHDLARGIDPALDAIMQRESTHRTRPPLSSAGAGNPRRRAYLLPP